MACWVKFENLITIYHFALGTSSTSSLGRLQGLSGVLSSRETSNSESSPGPSGPSGHSVSLATPTAAAAVTSSNEERVRELMSRLPPAPPVQMGVITETVAKRSFTEEEEVAPLLQKFPGKQSYL